MAYKDFVNDKNKGLLKDVLLFYGAEDFLMNWAVDSIVNEYVDDSARDIDLVHLEGDQVTAADIMAQARAYSMFSERRVIVVRNYLPLYRKASDPDADALLDFASGPQDSSVVMFVVESRYSSDLTSYGKKLAKACGAYEFARLERADLKAFITKRVHNGGRMIARRELEHMIDVTGYYNKEKMYMLFGGRFDEQPLAALPEEYRKKTRIIPYNRCLMYYRKDYYALLMPCGELKAERIDTEQLSIFEQV